MQHLSICFAIAALCLTGCLAGAAGPVSGAEEQLGGHQINVATPVLGVDGTAFTLNGKKTFLLGASYYGALGAPDDFIARDLNDLQALGFNWIRVFAVWDAFDNYVSAVDKAGKAREPYLSKLKALVVAAGKRGMVVDVTLARMPCLPDRKAHLQAVETLAKALKGCRNVYFDLANERDQHYEGVFVSYAELRALRDRAKAVDPDRLATASGDPTDRAELARYLVDAGLDFISPHLARDAGTEKRTADATRKYLGWMRELGRMAPIHYQEPFRRDYLDHRGFWQPEVETFRADLRNAKLGGAAGWCFHNGSPSPPERFPVGKRRSFDMRPAQGRLMDQLDSVERQFLKCASLCLEDHPLTRQHAAAGPLRVHPTNPRFFTDGTKGPDGSLKAVYLTGSHHWNNLQDSGRLGGPITNRFDYDSYLKRLGSWNHNFIRLWGWEGPAWWYQGGQNDHYYEPLPWARASREMALDGKPKFDLNQFNEDYFKRLRSRVVAAGDKGMYVGVMLFQGWSIYSHGYGNPWPGHPFNQANNVNAINGDPNGDGEGKEVHTLGVSAVTRRQEAYVRKVIDTLNDLDNVLYEISNETAIWSREWQYHIIRFIKEYEARRPKQHPVGITAFDSGREGSMAALLASPADWISPQNDGTPGDYQNDPPAGEGRKVILSDTDHLWGVGGDRAWVWKSFLRGHHPIYMDPLRKEKWFPITEADMESARRAMGHTRSFAERMNLAAMIPQPKMASTRYCLANPGSEYLVFQPRSGSAFTVDLKTASYRYEWFDAAKGAVAGQGSIKVANSPQQFRAPFDGDAVLYLKVIEPE